MPKNEDGDFSLGGGCVKDLIKVPFWILMLALSALVAPFRKIRR